MGQLRKFRRGLVKKEYGSFADDWRREREYRERTPDHGLGPLPKLPPFRRWVRAKRPSAHALISAVAEAVGRARDGRDAAAGPKEGGGLKTTGFPPPSVEP